MGHGDMLVLLAHVLEPGKLRRKTSVGAVGPLGLLPLRPRGEHPYVASEGQLCTDGNSSGGDESTQHVAAGECYTRPHPFKWCAPYHGDASLHYCRYALPAAWAGRCTLVANMR